MYCTVCGTLLCTVHSFGRSVGRRSRPFSFSSPKNPIAQQRRNNQRYGRIVNMLTKTKNNKSKTITDAKPGDRVELIAGKYVAKYKNATFVSWPPFSKLHKKSMYVRFNDGNTACLRLSSLRLIVECDSASIGDKVANSPVSSFGDGSVGNTIVFTDEKVPVYVTEEQLRMLREIPRLQEQVDLLSETVATLSLLVKDLLDIVKKQ
jgi:hypothetical protein